MIDDRATMGLYLLMDKQVLERPTQWKVLTIVIQLEKPMKVVTHLA